MSAEEKPLSRWSRRKAEARKADTRSRGAAAPELPDEPLAVPAEAGDAEIQPETSEVPPPDLPDIDSLDADSDYSVFMQAGVPAALRRLALRKLWRSDPLFSSIDEMVEYGEDFTDAATVVGNLESAYKVGKGYIREEADEEEPAEEEAVPAVSEEAPEADAEQSDPGEEENDQPPEVAADEDDPTSGTG